MAIVLICKQVCFRAGLEMDKYMSYLHFSCTSRSRTALQLPHYHVDGVHGYLHSFSRMIGTEVSRILCVLCLSNVMLIVVAFLVCAL
jgi:hypothetical protein